MIVNCCNTLTRICTIFTRIVITGYAVLASFTFLEALDLATSDSYHYDSDSGIVYVPLFLCAPPSIENNEISFDNSNCRHLDYFICSACSTFACVFFVIMDIFARYKKGPFNMSTVAGMGLYLTIILVQAGFSTGALVEQNIYYINYLDDKSEFDVNVESYANTKVFLSSACCAFVAAFLVVVDTILYRFNGKRQIAMKNQAIDDFVCESIANVESVAHTSIVYDLNKSKTVDTIEDRNKESCPDNSLSSTPSWAS